MDAASPDIIKHLLNLAKNERKRKLDWPNDWQPYEVTNPADGQPFTNESAWEMIVYLLETFEEWSVVEQRNPAGSMAYVFHYKQADGWKIYVKLRMNKNRNTIFGRSFHYDEGQVRDE